MTQELAQKLIAWYEESIAMIKEEDMKTIIGILKERVIGYGVCKCALFNFDMELYSDSWAISQTKSGHFWHKTPGKAATKEEVIQCLQLRVDILKTFDGE